MDRLEVTLLAAIGLIIGLDALGATGLYILGYASTVEGVAIAPTPTVTPQPEESETAGQQWEQPVETRRNTPAPTSSVARNTQPAQPQGSVANQYHYTYPPAKPYAPYYTITPASTITPLPPLPAVDYTQLKNSVIMSCVKAVEDAYELKVDRIRRLNQTNWASLIQDAQSKRDSESAECYSRNGAAAP
jgi:hypothetical protein